MRRMWFGTALLLLLIALGIFVTVSSNALHTQIAHTLEDAAAHAQAGNWEEAQRSFQRAYSRWKQRHQLVAAITDHEPMEQIDSLFHQLMPVLGAKEQISFISGCRGLIVLVQAVGEAHGVNWWNLL